jgi:hypothetical protein
VTNQGRTTTEWEILPHEGVGPIRFGMSAEQVRTAVGAPVTTFMKTPLAELPTDSFDELGLHVYYRRPGLCDFVEFYGPPGPHIRGMSFLSRPLSEVWEWLQGADPGAEVEPGEGLTSHILGIAIYAPAAVDDPDPIVEGVAIFEQGYYDTPTRS